MTAPRHRRLLVVGGGGREHAIADRLRGESPGAALFVAPGNPGTGEIARNVPIAASDVEGLVDFAVEERIDLTVVGPEMPLAAGLVDRLEAAGRPAFGPTAAAARLESSKAFAKRLMRDLEVPTAGFATFTSASSALAHLGVHSLPVVVKASGLAAGKGALICQSLDEARGAVREMLEGERFGEAGREIVIEEYLQGQELSVFFLTDGREAVPLAPSRDHKRRLEGDRGPNTGGMGAYAPVSDAGPDLVEEVRRTIALPVLGELEARGTPYRGVLYVGLMLTSSGPSVVEFNCRLGDPEAQVVLPLTSGELLPAMEAVARGESLGDWRPGPTPGAALVTVLVSEGYPGAYERGKPITIPAGVESESCRIYHAGTARRDGQLVTDGGRVLGVTGLGPTLPEAAARSREGAERIHFEGKDWRSDIGRSEWGTGD